MISSRALPPIASLLFLVVAAVPARPQATLPPDFQDEVIVGALSTPTGLAFLPDGRCFVTEQLTARIRLIVNGALSTTDPVCVVPNVRNNNFFRGLLGIAVDHYAANPGKVLLSRFTAAGDLGFTGSGALTIDPATRYDLINGLTDANHNGGTLRFGPDQMLYASVGDSFTVPCAAQRIGSMRGVIWRLEIRNLPAGSGGPPAKSLLTPPDNPFVSDSDPNARLIWARGLRHPFRFHVDHPTGDVFIADVGEDTWEEVSRVGVPGANFGWPLFEGPDAYTTCPGASGGGLTAPIHSYGGGAQRCIIGGGVYRRPTSGSSRFPFEYEGDYFFSDYYSGALRRLEGSGQSWALASPMPGQPSSTDWGTGLAEVSDYLVAADGSLWYCRQGIGGASNTGEIRRIAYTGVTGVESPPSTTLILEAPHPSPGVGQVTLHYRLPALVRIDLKIYDVAGRLVRTLVAGIELPAGTHTATWDGRSDAGELRAGMFFARLRTDLETRVRPLVLLR